MSAQVTLDGAMRVKASKAAGGVEEIVGDGFDVRKFVESFEVLSEALGGVGKLRWLLLELGVRGRLVPQDSNEGDGATALERARRHEASLVQKGDLRRRAPYSAVRPEDQLFVIPLSWVWTRFGELGDWGAGATPSRSNPSYFGGATPWFKSGELNDSYVETAEENVTDVALRDCSLRLNAPGDVLIAMYGATIGKVALTRKVCTTNQAVCACTCHEGISNEFLLRLLKGFRYRFIEQGAGGAQPNISRVKIVETPCPLPPLVEQKRIVAKLDQLMALCDDLEARQTKKREVAARLTKSALEALTTAQGQEEFDASWKTVAENFPTIVDHSDKVPSLRRTILELAVRGRLVPADPTDAPAAHLLASIAEAKGAGASASRKGTADADVGAVPTEDGDRFHVPAQWEWAKVGDTFEVAGGIQKTPLRAPVANHHPYLRVENVQRGRLDLRRMERFELQPGELERKRLVAGDLLVVEGNGSETEIGRCALWDGSIENCVHQNHIIRCRPIGSMWSPFALLFLNSPTGMEEMKRLAITTSGLYSLSVGKIRGIFLPLPPLAEQKRIVMKVRQLMKICDDLEGKLRRAEDRAAKLVEAVVQELVA